MSVAYAVIKSDICHMPVLYMTYSTCHKKWHTIKNKGKTRAHYYFGEDGILTRYRLVYAQNSLKS